MRRPGTRGLAAALLMAALLLLYLALTVQRAIAFLAAGSALGTAFGVALLVLPLVAVALVGREIAFGAASGRLLRRYAEDGRRTPGDGLTARPSGRLDRASGAAAFAEAAEDVERHPDDWHAWFGAGLAYDLCGDRRRARSAVRRAIALERTGR